MVKVEETGTTYKNGTYEIETDAKHLHIACFLSPDPPEYLFRGQDMGFNPGGGFGNMLFLETGGRLKHSAFSNVSALVHFRRPVQRYGHKRTLAPVWGDFLQNSSTEKSGAFCIICFSKVLGLYLYAEQPKR